LNRRAGKYRMWINNKGILQEKGLLDLGIKHFCSTKNSGDMLLKKERGALLGRLGIEAGSLVTAGQVHGSAIRLAGPRDAGKKFPDTDALLVRTKNLPVGIFTADCVPLFLADRKRSLACLVHAGWRGLAKGIVEKAAGHFEPETAVAAIGPHICEKCYKVGENMSETFPDSYAGGHLCLACEIRQRLRSCGIKDENITRCDDCTYHDRDSFYSYRRGDIKKRMISVIML
jgi:polyphenol oxidase